MPKHRLLVWALFLAVTAACSNPVDLSDPNSVAAELRGTWSQAFDAPGNSTVFVVGVEGLTISGTGTFAGEVGPFGTLSLSGQVTSQQTGRPRVQIDFAQSNGSTGHFSGSLTNANSLNGIVWYSSSTVNGDPVPATFRRQ